MKYLRTYEELKVNFTIGGKPEIGDVIIFKNEEYYYVLVKPGPVGLYLQCHKNKRVIGRTTFHQSILKNKGFYRYTPIEKFYKKYPELVMSVVDYCLKDEGFDLERLINIWSEKVEDIKVRLQSKIYNL